MAKPFKGPFRKTRDENRRLKAENEQLRAALHQRERTIKSLAEALAQKSALAVLCGESE